MRPPRARDSRGILRPMPAATIDARETAQPTTPGESAAPERHDRSAGEAGVPLPARTDAPGPGVAWPVYLILLLLAWGLFAPDRGLFQDDVSALAAMSSVGVDPGVTPFNPITTATRRLLGPIFYGAWLTGHPVLALHLMWGAFWLAIALVAHKIASFLVPGNALAPYLAGALALCATGDFLFTSPVALGYLQAILTTLGALAFGLAWKRDGNVAWLLGSTLMVVISLWTVDVGLTALPILPVLILLAPPGGSGRDALRRIVALVASWGIATIPYLLTLIPAMASPSSYFRTATVEITLRGRAKETLKLWIANFTPWDWAFDRAAFFSRSPLEQPLPLAWMAGLALLGTAAFVLGMRRRLPRTDTASLLTLSNAAIVASLGALSLASNAMFAAVQLQEIHYRTHLLSGVWTAILVAVVAGLEGARRRWTIAVPIAFVGFGLLGGLERQGFYQGAWQEHQRELASIVAAAPALRPGTEVVLYVPAHPRYLATEIHYAQAWLQLLYGESRFQGAPYWAPEHRSGCRAEADGVLCWPHGKERCVTDGSCPGTRIPYERLVVFGYDVTSNSYRLLDRLPTEPPVYPAAYRPADRIVHRPLTTLQRRILMLGHRSPALWLPDVEPPAR